MAASITAVRALGLNGMVNRSELLINVVNVNKPKMLRGLDQKVSGQVQGFQFPLSQMKNHRRTGRT
jgi:hypothetical protein